MKHQSNKYVAALLAATNGETIQGILKLLGRERTDEIEDIFLEMVIQGAAKRRGISKLEVLTKAGKHLDYVSRALYEPEEDKPKNLTEN